MGGYTEIYVSAALSLGPQAERDTTFPHPFLKELKMTTRYITRVEVMGNVSQRR